MLLLPASKCYSPQSHLVMLHSIIPIIIFSYHYFRSNNHSIITNIIFIIFVWYWSSCSYDEPLMVQCNFLRFSLSPSHRATTVARFNYNIINATQGTTKQTQQSNEQCSFMLFPINNIIWVKYDAKPLYRENVNRIKGSLKKTSKHVWPWF